MLGQYVNIKRIDKTIPFPQFETDRSVGMDLLCRETIIVPSHEIALIPANIVVEVPIGFMLAICLRSSTPRKYGLIMPHSIGVIDQDYCGEDDEIKIQVYNFTNKEVRVKRMDRIAQAILMPVTQPMWKEVETMSKESRGGFGSTDN